MDEQIKKLEKEIEILKARNAKVEGDKAWETSWFRVFTIVAIIYIVVELAIYITMNFRIQSNPWMFGLFPALGYFISVQSLPFIKKWWIKKFTKK